MATTGIKTSLHEVRHGIIAELLDGEVQEITVLERFNGITKQKRGTNDRIQRMFILIAPYIKRIQMFDWDRFMEEYGGLTDIIFATREISHAKSKNIFMKIVNAIDDILNDNKELIDDMVKWLDRNGKGHHETINRRKFKDFMAVHPLKGKDKLKTLEQEVKAVW